MLTVEEVKGKFTDELIGLTDEAIEDLIEQADYVINFATRGFLHNQILYYSENTTDTYWHEHYVGIKRKAMMAQLEYWFHVGPETDIVARYRSYRVGESKIEYELTTLAPRAYRILRMGGAMNIGVTL